MKIKEKLTKKALSNTLNVEDIIESAATRDIEVATVLQGLKESNSWPTESIETENGNITPPMGMWVDVALLYIHEGYEGLVKLSRQEEKVSFVTTFLESYNTNESVDSLVRISKFYTNDFNSHKATLLNITSSLNILLSFPTAPKIDDNTASNVRNLIHKMIDCCADEAEYATVICALRGVGNEESLELLAKVPQLKGAWAGTEKIVKKVITKRLKEM